MGQPADQVDLSANSPDAAWRRLRNGLHNQFRRSNVIGLLYRLQRAFRVNDDVHIGVFQPRTCYLLSCEARVHRAMALPEDHLGALQRLRRVATQGLEGVPQHHLVQGHAHLGAGVATEVLVREEQDALALLEGPCDDLVGV